MGKRARATSVGGSIGLGIFGIAWCVFVIFFDAMLFAGLPSQIASTFWKPTDCEIIKSEVAQKSGEDGPSHGVTFEYKYRVAGQEYTGTHYTFDKSTSSDSAWAYEAVSAFPAGAKRICYVNPGNPSRAVLSPGLHGSDFFALMFMTPFHLIGIGCLTFGVHGLRKGPLDETIPPRYVDRMRDRIYYPIGTNNPLLVFLICLLAVSFLGVFIVAFGRSGAHPSLFKIGLVWGSGIAASIAAALHVRSQRNRGRYDMVLDRNTRTLELPRIRTRREAVTLLIPELREPTLRVETDSEGSTQYHVELPTKSNETILVHSTSSEAAAEQLVNTLKQIVG